MSSKLRPRVMEVLFLGMTFLPGALCAEVIPYPEYAGAPKSTYCSVSVDGTPVFVHSYKNKHYAHFAFTGEVTVTVTSLTAATSLDIQPKPYGIVATKNGNSYSFKLNQPRKLVLTFNATYDGNQPALFIFAEGPEVNPPKLGDANVKNIMDYGVDSTGRTEATAKINQAITETAAKTGGGVVYIPKGVYKSGTVVMKSNVTLYLEGGAYVLAAGATQMTSIKTQSNWSGVCMIGFDKLTNAHVTGRGTFDWNGGQWGYDLGQCRRCSMEGVILRNCNRWTVHPVNCDSIQFINIKIMNVAGPCCNDAFNFDVCRHVLMDDCFGWEQDDFATACGTPGVPSVPIEDYVIRNTVAANNARLFLVKSGSMDEARYTGINGITIENTHHIIAPAYGSVSFIIDGDPQSGQGSAVCQNIIYRNCSSGAISPWGVHIKANYTLKNVTIENLEGWTSPASAQFFFFLDGGTIENISVKCVKFGGQTISSMSQLPSSTLNTYTFTFQPCDASVAAPFMEGAGTAPSIFGFASGTTALVDLLGAHRLLILRPDGRAIAERQGLGRETFDLKRIAGGIPGVYVVQLIHDGGTLTRTIAGH